MVAALHGVDLPAWSHREPAKAGPGDAERGLEATMELARETGSVHVYAFAAGALARHHLASGNAQPALTVATSAANLLRRTGGWEWAGGVVSAAVEAFLTLGRSTEAGHLSSELRHAVEGRSAPEAHASLLLCEGMLAEGAGHRKLAIARFEGAQAAWEALSRQYDAALAQERLGRAVLAIDPARGTRVLTAAAGSFTVLGSSWRAASILDFLGTRAPARSVRGDRGTEALSPREEQVVQLAAQGRTNREIAHLLGISERTVESHVRRALQRQGTATRLRRGRAFRLRLDSAP